jgi:hypothetical protein
MQSRSRFAKRSSISTGSRSLAPAFVVATVLGAVAGALGLARDRVAYIAERGSGWLLTVCDLAPEWWNFSELSSSVQLFGSLNDEDLVRAALSRAAAWLGSRGRERWTVMARITGNPDVVGSCLSMVGCEQAKTYRRIGVPRH